MVPLRYVLIPIFIVTIAGFIFYLVTLMASAPQKKIIENKAPLVEVLDIERKNITLTVKSQGNVVPRTETSLVAEVSGMVTSVADTFQVGGFFKQGEVMLTIDDTHYQVALVQAQSNLELAKAGLLEEKAWAKQAKDEWLLTGKSLDKAPVLALRLPQQQKAQARLLSAQAELKAAKARLAKTKIIAPYDALVKAKKVDIGQYVTTGTPVAVTFAIDYAEVRLPIKPKDIPFLNLPHLGKSTAQASNVALSYRILSHHYTWSSELLRTEGVIDPNSRVQYVIARIDDPYGLKANNTNEVLHIGTFVNASITGKQAIDVVAIPRAAIREGNLLYLLDQNNQLSIVQLDVLRTDKNYVYTHDEFSSKQKIILTNLAIPVSGMNLRVAESKKVASEKSLIELGVSE